MKIRISALIVFAIVMESCDSQQPPIIAKYLSYTGLDRSSKIESIVMTGQYDYGGIKFPFTTTAKAPNSYKVLVPFQGKYFAQAYDGKNGWKIDAFKNETKPTLLSGAAARELINEENPETESQFVNYKSKGISWKEGNDTTLLVHDTTATESKRVARKITMIKEDKTTEFYFFDIETGALLLKKARSKNPELNRIWLTTYFYDYRDVDGMKFPFRTEHQSNGQKILTISVNKIGLNEPVDNNEFQPAPVR